MTTLQIHQPSSHASVVRHRDRVGRQGLNRYAAFRVVTSATLGRMESTGQEA